MNRRRRSGASRGAQNWGWLLLAAVVSACMRDGENLVFNYHWTTALGDRHGPSTGQHRARITGEAARILIVGRIPLEGYCPRLNAVAGNRDHTILLRVVVLPDTMSQGPSCSMEGHPSETGEYIAELRGLEEGVYSVRVVHMREAGRTAGFSPRQEWTAVQAGIHVR